ncbi:MDIS1-interacting receptor like kinase 2-like [Neltuma alba]|uniref:MDIS1-interacting receptor like kinase 2-like n=1 Tax=Neltuma alba TaxID=207710 RepID=UPI0010A3E817|nr:MDIS1-interacting receptor like kinase 2-like [Prosopis alba]
MEGGTLADFLKNDTKALKLDWLKRVDIVKCVAEALSYMHHDCDPPIIHRDISSKNILLSGNLEAHVSDFGTAMFLKSNSSVLTAFAGTLGYAAPELAYTITVSEKCDVFSFGVLAFEILMGKHPGDLISHVHSFDDDPNINFKKILDPRLSPPKEQQKLMKEVILIEIKLFHVYEPTLHVDQPCEASPKWWIVLIIISLFSCTILWLIYCLCTFA